MLQSMGSQKVGHDSATEQQNTMNARGFYIFHWQMIPSEPKWILEMQRNPPWIRSLFK